MNEALKDLSIMENIDINTEVVLNHKDLKGKSFTVDFVAHDKSYFTIEVIANKFTSCDIQSFCNIKRDEILSGKRMVSLTEFFCPYLAGYKAILYKKGESYLFYLKTCNHDDNDIYFEINESEAKRVLDIEYDAADDASYARKLLEIFRKIAEENGYQI